MPCSKRRSPVFDEIEPFDPVPPARWPLHPTPRLLERLDFYVARLAKAYGMGLATFCRHALQCEIGDIDRCRHAPPEHLLVRLSHGTGLPIRRFRNMTEYRVNLRREVGLRWMLRCDPDLVQKMSKTILGPE